MNNHYLVGASVFALCLTGCGANYPRHDIGLSPCSISAEPVMESQETATLDMSDSRSGIIRVLDGKPFCPKNKCDHRKIIGWNYNCSIEEASTGQIVAEIEGCDRDEIRWPAMQEVFDVYGGRQKYIESRCYSE